MNNIIFPSLVSLTALILQNIPAKINTKLYHIRFSLRRIICLESGPSHLFCPLRPLDIQPEAEISSELLLQVLCLSFAVPISMLAGLLACWNIVLSAYSKCVLARILRHDSSDNKATSTSIYSHTCRHTHTCTHTNTLRIK